MKKHLSALPTLFIAAVASSCSSGFGDLHSQARLVVTIEGGNVGSPQNRLPLAFTPQAPLTLRIEAHTADGKLDDAFNGWLRVSVKPGTVYSVNGGDNGRNVELTNGVATGVVVPLVAAYGETHIWAEDLGYVPVKNLARDPPPQCADGIDNDGDGTIDFPADSGCFASNDDTETGGTYAVGTTPSIYYALPRIADVRGYSLNGGSATAFPGEQVRMDTGYNELTQRFDFDVVVTRISSDGFYVTDVTAQATNGYASIFAFTFSAPTKLRVCDRFKGFSGTASDFFGFTEVGFPTWSVEYYDPTVRPCLVPEPTVLSVTDLANTKSLFHHESALVRVQTAGTVSVHVASHFGNKHPPPPQYIPDADSSNCDLNGNGKVDFGDPMEAACGAACTSDIECSEFTNFITRANFDLVVKDSNGALTGRAEANGSSAPGFDPVVLKGAPIKSFTGTFRYFSGGSQFTMEARCGDDIVTDLKATIPAATTACVRPRTDVELSQSH